MKPLASLGTRSVIIGALLVASVVFGTVFVVTSLLATTYVDAPVISVTSPYQFPDGSPGGFVFNSVYDNPADFGWTAATKKFYAMVEVSPDDGVVACFAVKVTIDAQPEAHYLVEVDSPGAPAISGISREASGRWVKAGANAASECVKSLIEQPIPTASRA